MATSSVSNCIIWKTYQKSQREVHKFTTKLALVAVCICTLVLQLGKFSLKFNIYKLKDIVSNLKLIVINGVDLTVSSHEIHRLISKSQISFFLLTQILKLYRRNIFSMSFYWNKISLYDIKSCSQNEFLSFSGFSLHARVWNNS